MLGAEDGEGRAVEITKIPWSRPTGVSNRRLNLNRRLKIYRKEVDYVGDPRMDAAG
jgi:hypothetical protein